MANVLVIYDLNTPGQDYEDLIAAIKDLTDGYWHHLDSTWIVRTSLSVSQVHARLRSHMDDGDELLVIDITRDPVAWSGFSAAGSEWLNKYL